MRYSKTKAEESALEFDNRLNLISESQFIKTAIH